MIKEIASWKSASVEHSISRLLNISERTSALSDNDLKSEDSSKDNNSASEEEFLIDSINGCVKNPALKSEASN